MTRSILSKTGLFLAGALTATMGTALAQTAGPLFPDIEENAFYTAAVGKFVRAGVIRGYESGYFGPQDTVTRAQVAVMFDRYDLSATEPLRAQIAEIRTALNLGACGDGTVQTGEECDDKNTMDGDGCSERCSAEFVAPPLPTMCSYGGKLYKLNEGFPADDGCNTCTCMAGGSVACTLMFCAPEEASSSSTASSVASVAPKKCVSDTQCTNGTVCSVRYGDCESLCDDAACADVCAGWCVAPESEEEPEESSSSVNTAPVATSSAANECKNQMAVIDDFFSQEYACKTDSDCRLFRANCPYITCGVAISSEVEDPLTALVEDFTAECNVTRCVSCADAGVACKQGKCALR
jgi:cysteine-rich repeat protein